MLNPHLGEFDHVSLGDPPVWKLIDTGTGVEIQTGDGTTSIEFSADGSVAFPSGYSGPTGTIDADTLDGLDSTEFVQTNDDIDAETLDGFDSTAFVRTASAIDAETLDGYDSDEIGVLDEDESVTGEWGFNELSTGTLTVSSRLTVDGTLRIPTVTSDPSSPETGTLWYNSADDAIRARLADETIEFGTGTNPTPPATYLEDFEDNVWPDDWMGVTGQYSIVTSPALEGTYTLSGAPSNQIANGNISTPRNSTYRCLARAASNGGAPGFLTNVQSAPTGLFDNCYWAQFNTVEDRLHLHKRAGGGTTTLNTTQLSSGAVDSGITYQLEMVLTSSTVRARVRETDGTLIGETTAVSDTQHTGGYLGIYPGGSGTNYFDAFEKV